MKFTSEVCMFLSETAATSMLDFRSIIFCLLLGLFCPLYAVLATGIDSGNDAGEDFTEQKCNNDADCTILHSRCMNSICQCDNGYVINGSLTACVPVATGYGDYCNESTQCSKRLYGGAACLNNTCACLDGYYYFNGRCNAYSGLFDKCKSDVDCYVHAEYGATYCNNGKCNCSPGYYQREYRTCRPEGKKVGDACVIKNDCRFSETAYCNRSYMCDETELDTTIESFFSLYEEQSSNRTERDLDNCTTDADCKNITNTECSPLGKCVCIRAHFYQDKLYNDTCIPELGEPCDVSDKISIYSSECKNKKWNCMPGYLASTDNRICRKATKNYGWSCVHDEQCSIFGPDSDCKDGKCVCNERSHFVKSELFCWSSKELGKSCQQDFDCHINGTEDMLDCKENVCVCPDGTHADSSGTSCLENFVGIGSNCTIDTDCQPENSMCQEKYCTCNENYVSDSFKSCVPLAWYGELCDLDIQCSAAVPNAVCLSDDGTDTNKTCRCSVGQHLKFDRCNVMKVLGDSCTNLGECYLSSNMERATCRNGRCACDWDYIRVNDTMCAPHSKARYNNNGNTVKSISGGLLSILLTTLLSVI